MLVPVAMFFLGKKSHLEPLADLSLVAQFDALSHINAFLSW